MRSRAGRLRWAAAWLWTMVRHPVSVSAARGAVLRSPARLQGRLRLERGALVFRGLDCVGPVRIGERSFVNAYCYLRPGVVIGDDVSIASHVKLITDSHEIGTSTRRAVRETTRPIEVGNGAWIGANSTVLPGVRIGAGAVVAAGSVVVHDVPPDTLVAGVPAVVKRELP